MAVRQVRRSVVISNLRVGLLAMDSDRLPLRKRKDVLHGAVRAVPLRQSVEQPWRPTAFWFRSGRRFPPQDLRAPRLSRHVRYPRGPGPEGPPLRPERHVSTSIATLRITLARALVRSLQRCPCCYQAKIQLMTQ